ncbi:MAG TPA: flagellar biosynthesis protein FlhF [Bacillota bacterium]|nr:flagellar biosynthesis protein FlhF [Bacillota bacterium]
MKLKKIIAPTMPEAMQRIRKELGRNAVILQSKEIKTGGILGFFQKKQMEVVAALDPEPLPKDIKRENGHVLADSFSLDEKKRPSYESGKSEQPHILAELKQMKKLLELSRISKTGPQSLSIDYTVPYQYLIDQEVDADLAEDILLSIQQTCDQDLISARDIKSSVQKEIARRLKDVKTSGITFDEHIVHFIGPTGVGKTTTLAKIAAKAKLENNKKVAFITTDTYRIAAIEQLKTYARILEVPIKVAYSKVEYDEAIKSFSNYDQIYVDTAGRNYREHQFVEDVTHLIEGEDRDQVTMLVLSSSSKAKDVLAIYDQFKHIGNQSVIFTKVDETRQFGSLLNISLLKDNHIAYMTNGQDVPDDVIEAHPESIASYVMRGYDDE